MDESFLSWVIIAAILLLALLVSRSLGRWRVSRQASPKAAPDMSVKMSVKPELAADRSESQTFTPEAEGRWYGPGERVTAAGYTISDGMVYVGRFLSVGTKGTSWPVQEPDPSLINPDLPVSRTTADLAGTSMTYWPSYSDIQPAARSAYLQWLSSGKRDPQVYIGYVFLYFYGIERRLLIDRPVADEVRKLVDEIERLRSLYSTNNSFDRYSRNLLDAVRFLGLLDQTAGPDSATPNLMAHDTKLSLPLKIRIGRMIKGGQPLPFELTLAAYMSANRMPMPAERCRAEFAALMRERFARKYPDGFKVRPRHGPLQTWYRGASKYVSFDLLEGKLAGAVPDPDLMSWERLDDMVTEACEALGPYARFIGRKPDKRNSLEAINLLPPEIRGAAVSSVGKDLRSWLEREAAPLATLPLKDLALRVLGGFDGKPTAKTLRALADILDEFGYGVEPDPRFTSLRADGDDVSVLFKAPNAAELTREPREAYRLASAIVTLVAGIANASADGFGEHELRWVEWIDKRLSLTLTEAARLRAHLYWLIAKKVSLGQIKRILERVPAAERESVARFAAAVAAADGAVDKTEVSFLEKISDELGVDRATIYSALHESTTAFTPAESAPVTGFKIPRPPQAEKPGSYAKPDQRGDSGLDTRRISKVMEETHQVSAILANVFVEETSSVPEHDGSRPRESAVGHNFDGLDTAHGRLLARLLERDTWTRVEFEAAARGDGLMPDGALETINEWSYDVADEALIEDDGDIKVNRTLAQELAA